MREDVDGVPERKADERERKGRWAGETWREGEFRGAGTG